jgi:hypothetical protein
MFHRITKQRTNSSIARLLAGLLFVSCLLNAVNSLDGLLLFADDRLHEVEVFGEEVNESRELDSALGSQFSIRSSALTWEKIQVVSIVQPASIERRSHHVRGPPQG